MEDGGFPSLYIDSEVTLQVIQENEGLGNMTGSRPCALSLTQTAFENEQFGAPK